MSNFLDLKPDRDTKNFLEKFFFYFKQKTLDFDLDSCFFRISEMFYFKISRFDAFCRPSSYASQILSRDDSFKSPIYLKLRKWIPNPIVWLKRAHQVVPNTYKI
jgi:hypothetical protein